MSWLVRAWMLLLLEQCDAMAAIPAVYVEVQRRDWAVNEGVSESVRAGVRSCRESGSWRGVLFRLDVASE